MRQHSRHSFYASLWRPVPAGNGNGSAIEHRASSIAPMPHDDASRIPRAIERFNSTPRADRHVAGALALCRLDTHEHTCKTSLVTDSAFCYRTYRTYAATYAATSAAMRFLLFCSHLFETGIWVVRAEKGHDGNASFCRGKRHFLRASRQSPSMPSVISGLHRRSQNWCCSVLLDRKSS